MKELQNIAVVIDADNTKASKMEAMLREISTRGRIVTKRAYGNWKKESLKNWESVLKRLAINAQQQFDYVAGKNATDMALVINTIDLLYRNIYDGFVIVSSDSDYTPLAIRLRESGVYVMGIGEQKTPESFRNSCDEFIFLENLQNDDTSNESFETSQNNIILRDDIEVIHGLLRTAYENYQTDDGVVQIGAAGSFIKRAKPDFDSRMYGYRTLSKLVESFPEKYETIRNYGKGHSAVVYRCIECMAIVKAEPQKTRSTEIKANSYNVNDIHILIKKAYELHKKANGYCTINVAGTFIRKTIPDFNSKNYGYKKLSELLEGFPNIYNVKHESTTVYFKIK